MKYGRQSYDFQDGSLMFLAPEQTLTIEGEEEEARGWTIAFHPDLVRGLNLGQNMHLYSFFAYEVYEALHLSTREKETLEDIALKIEQEYGAQLDDHSHTLIASNLELLLNYCNRFYGRQFLTRHGHNHDVVAEFERFLNEYFDSERPRQLGPPTAASCAEAMRYSPNYLSDLLKKATGKTTLEHIHLHQIERAKTMLMSSSAPVREISQLLGFEYSQYFSRFFKKHTGRTPAEYRKVS
jgi:AraC-like DNA-binding protein